MTAQPLRVLHCPHMVGGNSQHLARAERQLGLQSWAVSFRSSKFQYATDEVLWREQDGRLLCEAKRWHMLLRALWSFDVIHFNFGKTLFPEPGFPVAGGQLSWKSRLRNMLVGGFEL